MSIEERLDICEAALKGELTIEEARRPLVELGGRSFGPQETKELERQLDQLKERLKQKLADASRWS